MKVMLAMVVLGLARNEMKVVGGCKLPGAEQEAASGGAHGTVAGEEPFQGVFKDGFWHVNCLSDELNVKGDKFGDGAQRYESGVAATTSVVRYDVVVDRDAQVPMTPDVCFNFCRTVPEMTFFGLIYGRDCYCSHYYKQTTGDGVCDRPCEGDSAVTCGGQTMSDIYQMHECVGGLAQDISAITAEAAEMNGVLMDDAQVVGEAGHAMQGSGDYLESLTEGSASSLAQAAKVAAGPILHAADDLLELSGEYTRIEGEAAGIPTDGELDFETRRKAETLLAETKEFLDAADQAVAAGAEWLAQANPEHNVEDAGQMFVPVLRQVDKEKEDRQSVCNGDFTGSPKVGLSLDECVAACDAEAPKDSDAYCWAIQHFTFDEADSLCFLFSGLSELTSYECGGDAGPMTKFLQRKKHRKHHRKHRKHQVTVRKHRAHVTPAHPSSRIMQAVRMHYTTGKRGGMDATCQVRFSDVQGVTPEFKDGITHITRCFGSG